MIRRSVLSCVLPPLPELALRLRLRHTDNIPNAQTLQGSLFQLNLPDAKQRASIGLLMILTSICSIYSRKWPSFLSLTVQSHLRLVDRLTGGVGKTSYIS